ncbi:MAG: LacI family DNA-binding transcriptional regulator [Microbacterium arborescens]
MSDGARPVGRATLADVAAAAGVSVGTASRALRGRGELAADTRARVLAAARTAGYARADEPRGRPRDGTARAFDLVLGHFHDPYTDEVVAGARTAAAELNYDLVLTAERDDPADDWPARTRARGSAGVLMGVLLPTSAQLAVVRDAGIPLVLVDPPSGDTHGLPSIRTTDRAGGAAAAAHLLECGARRFVVVGGVPAYRYGRARVEGFTATVAGGAPGAPCVVTTAGWRADDAHRAAAQALDELASRRGGGSEAAADGGPIGLFACSDEMAAGSYRAVAEAGLVVGRDVLVVGFDDVRGARWLHPPLTTIRQPIREMAAAGVRMLADLARGREPADAIVELPTQLIARASTRGAVTPRASAPASAGR